MDGGEAALHGDAVVFTTATGRRLRYSKLVATDANGAALVARLEVPAPDRLQLWVDETVAVYPLTIDPILTALMDAQLESNQLVAQLGRSVSGAGDVNGDGYDDVIVGANLYDEFHPPRRRRRQTRARPSCTWAPPRASCSCRSRAQPPR